MKLNSYSSMPTAATGAQDVVLLPLGISGNRNGSDINVLEDAVGPVGNRDVHLAAPFEGVAVQFEQRGYLEPRRDIAMTLPAPSTAQIWFSGPGGCRPCC